MSTGPRTQGAPSTRGQRAFIGAAIVGFAVLSCYLALVIITHIDSIFLPGNEITLGGIPGKDALQKVGIDPGNSGPRDRINILVMGLDRRPRDGDLPTRTDTLFVVTIDPKTKSSAILGIPRDLLVDIPSEDGTYTYQDRVNTIYVAGETYSPGGGGVKLMRQFLKDQWDIKIDKYVIIDFSGFQKVIDALGGIDVDVPEEVYDPYYSESERRGDYNPQHFYPGRQHMDGSSALAYSRIRFSSDDLDRIQRQQRVIFAVIEKANSLDVLSHAVSLWSKYKDAIHTDIGDAVIPGYAILAGQVMESVQAVSLGPATVPYTTREGASVLLGDKAAIQEIVDSLFVDKPGSLPGPTPSSEPVSVAVQNGTSMQGLAGRVVDFIAAQGYPPDKLHVTDAWDGKRHNDSEILYLNETGQGRAFVLSGWLSIAPERVRAATAAERQKLSADTQIVVILGADNDFDTLIKSPTTAVPGG